MIPMAPENQSTTQQAVQAAGMPLTPPAAPPAMPSKPETPIKLPKLGKWRILQIAAFAIIGVWTIVNLIWLWMNGIDPKGVLWALWWPGIFLIQYSILSTPWRAITLKELGRMFLLGMSVAFLGAWITEMILVGALTAYPDINPIYQLARTDLFLGAGADISGSIVAPIVEETFKILPVIAFLLIAARGYWKRALGPLDIGLMAGASGAGQLFMENLAREIAGYWGNLGPNRWALIVSPGIRPFYLFPDTYFGDASVWLGHPEAAMLVGLGLGFGLFIRKKFPLWFVIPGIVFIYVVWLHAMVNTFGGAFLRLWWAKILLALHINGGMSMYILALGLLLALAVSMITKFLYLQKDKKATVPAVTKEFLAYVNANPGNPLIIVKKIWSLRHFWSFRHAVGYGMFYARQQKPGERKRGWMRWLISLRNQSLGKA